MDQQQIDAQVAAFWDEHNSDANFGGATYWLANEIINRRYQAKAVGGRPYSHWIDFCVKHFLASRCPVDRALSIGCGKGELERHLAGLSAARLIEGIDTAPKLIEEARQAAEEAGFSGRLNYVVANVETSPFPNPTYDAIFFNSSLHHMSDLNRILSRCSEALGEDGYLFVNEYIGPNRFDFSEREKQVLHAVFQVIPEKYRISRAAHNYGQVMHQLNLPDPAEVARVDPSESIHSEEIVEALELLFEIVEFNFTGGTLLQYLLDGIAGNFHAKDPDSVKVLESIFQIEDTLVETGDLLPHFALIIARPTGAS